MLITISRQFGAGGSEVARRVAAALGWSVVDNEFIDKVAARAGLAPEEVAEREERVLSFVERLALTMATSAPELFPPDTGTAEDVDETKVGSSLDRSRGSYQQTMQYQVPYIQSQQQPTVLLSAPASCPLESPRPSAVHSLDIALASSYSVRMLVRCTALPTIGSRVASTVPPSATRGRANRRAHFAISRRYMSFLPML